MDQPTDASAQTPPAQAAAATPPVPPDVVARLETLSAKLAAFEAAESARAEAARQKEAEDLLKKGQLEEIRKNHEAALAAKDKALADLLNKTKGAELRRALTDALADHKLVPGAAAQLQKLWADEFQVEEGEGGFKVLARSDLRDPKAVVAERLASREWAHFLLPEGRTQSAAAPSQAAPTGQQQSTAGLSSIEKLAAQLKAKYQTAGR